ncbi:hypothetical protein BuS5_01592 [Desulfosarcina sp. BuS5]|nr:hypothetical protein BuS5_01592 [Desulfosarcina sp. BuS5]
MRRQVEEEVQMKPEYSTVQRQVEAEEKEEGSSRISVKTKFCKHLQSKIIKISVSECSTDYISYSIILPFNIAIAYSLDKIIENLVPPIL